MSLSALRLVHTERRQWQRNEYSFVITNKLPINESVHTMSGSNSIVSGMGCRPILSVQRQWQIYIYMIYMNNTVAATQCEQYSRITTRAGSAWLTAEEENDCISMKKTNYSKSTLLYFLKVCLYGCYTKCQFYRISLFCP